ncbi:MAG: NAD(P)/FAD-dependent oxidoreductase [Oscillospiraceae bacterium]|nr:NAD(P)/FAD-dependent oxidoreductase [Oscillospiraceae bacterium]
MDHYDILIIGGGAAGVSAARAASGRRVLLADRGPALGGVLLQCTHRGFGNNQTGPEYMEHLLRDFPESVELALNTTVLSVSPEKTALLSGREFGRREVSFDHLILAAGCREIPAGALPIGGTRPEGVYTAGQMQALMNLRGYVPEGPAVILGSGDLGLIMAKHLAEAGLEVTLVEKKDSCGGMARNRRCLSEYPIRLLCGDTLAVLHGEKKLSGCTTAKGVYLPCKSLLIAVGLRPEQELIAHLAQPEWLTLCGNCRQVHPMVEAVVQEGKQAGAAVKKAIEVCL